MLGIMLSALCILSHLTEWYPSHSISIDGKLKHGEYKELVKGYAANRKALHSPLSASKVLATQRHFSEVGMNL